MAYVISHFYEGGTEAQYNAVLDAVHPSEGLPAGQLYHVAGPADGGWLIVAVWDSQASFDSFVNDTLMPTLAERRRRRLRRPAAAARRRSGERGEGLNATRRRARRAAAA